MIHMTRHRDPRYQSPQAQRSRPTDIPPQGVHLLASLWEIEKRLDAVSLELLEISAIESHRHEVRHSHSAR